MLANVPYCHFDRSKPFYPLVMQYVVSLLGFKELLGHGVGLRVQPLAVAAGISLEEAAARVNSEGKLKVRPGNFELWDPLKLRCRASAEPVGIDAESIAVDLVRNAHYLSRGWATSAIALLIAAYETCKDAKLIAWSEPTWQFLRHVRNASAHGNRFRMRPGEPRRPAHWRGLLIEPPLAGTKLFKEDPRESAFLDPGDPIVLLWDLEQTIPSPSIVGAPGR